MIWRIQKAYCNVVLLRIGNGEFAKTRKVLLAAF